MWNVYRDFLLRRAFGSFEDLEAKITTHGDVVATTLEYAKSNFVSEILLIIDTHDGYKVDKHPTLSVSVVLKFPAVSERVHVSLSSRQLSKKNSARSKELNRLAEQLLLIGPGISYYLIQPPFNSKISRDDYDCKMTELTKETVPDFHRLMKKCEK